VITVESVATIFGLDCHVGADPVSSNSDGVPTEQECRHPEIHLIIVCPNTANRAQPSNLGKTQVTFGRLLAAHSTLNER
jgi:hypothetical protein